MKLVIQNCKLIKKQALLLLYVLYIILTNYIFLYYHFESCSVERKKENVDTLIILHYIT